MDCESDFNSPNENLPMKIEIIDTRIKDPEPKRPPAPVGYTL